MRASVIIPAYRSADALERCLFALTRQQLAPGQHAEVVVSDDGSDDNTAEVVARFPQEMDLTYVYSPRDSGSGRARARNNGLRAASGDVAIFLDSDQIVAPDFIQQHLRIHQATPNVAVIGPRTSVAPLILSSAASRPERIRDRTYPIERTDERVRLLDERGWELADMAASWHFFWTCNASVRRTYASAAGGFDEGFKGWGLEDAEFGYRLSLQGLRFEMVRKAECFQSLHAPLTSDQHDEWSRNLAYFCTKHQDPAVALQALFQATINPRRLNSLRWNEAAALFELACRRLDHRHGDKSAGPEGR